MTTETARKIVGYILKDGQTGREIRTYGPASGAVAHRRRDKLDLEYGSYRYVVRPIFK